MSKNAKNKAEQETPQNPEQETPAAADQAPEQETPAAADQNPEQETPPGTEVYPGLTTLDPQKIAVYTPNTQFSGRRGSAVFENGRAVTDADTARYLCTTYGYSIIPPAQDDE